AGGHRLPPGRGAGGRPGRRARRRGGGGCLARRRHVARRGAGGGSRGGRDGPSPLRAAGARSGLVAGPHSSCTVVAGCGADHRHLRRAPSRALPCGHRHQRRHRRPGVGRRGRCRGDGRCGSVGLLRLRHDGADRPRVRDVHAVRPSVEGRRPARRSGAERGSGGKRGLDGQLDRVAPPLRGADQRRDGGTARPPAGPL
ncbi:MAG: Peptidase, M23/M37 family, partial [uncultured Acidimicrobiales bacterium]